MSNELIKLLIRQKEELLRLLGVQERKNVTSVAREPPEPVPFRSKFKKGSMEWWFEIRSQPKPARDPRTVDMNDLRRHCERPQPLPRSPEQARSVRRFW